ncbi:hypothetical protein BLJAPNOD_06269 [Ensifer sp. M14]|nr:hypothetical protein BLJAPNOD_06269 [Ensifer sp. M14]
MRLAISTPCSSKSLSLTQSMKRLSSAGPLRPARRLPDSINRPIFGEDVYLNGMLLHVDDVHNRLDGNDTK